MSEILKKPYPLGFLLTSSPLLLQSQMLIAVSEGLWGQDSIPIPWYRSVCILSQCRSGVWVGADGAPGFRDCIAISCGAGCPGEEGRTQWHHFRHTGFADDMVKKSGKWCVTDGLGSPVPL